MAKVHMKTNTGDYGREMYKRNKNQEALIFSQTKAEMKVATGENRFSSSSLKPKPGLEKLKQVQDERW